MPPPSDLVQHGEGVAVGVECGERAQPGHDVRLLRSRLEHHDGLRGHRVIARPAGPDARSRREVGRRPVRARPSWARLPAAASTTFDGTVVRGVIGGDVVARHRGDRLLAAEHLTAERMLGEERVGEQVVHEIVGRVVAHPDLFEDHLPLGLDVVGAEGGVPQHVGQDVERELELRVGDAHVEHGVLVGGERVHLAADRLDRLRDLACAQPLGALEQQVLEEVARAPLRALLVARAAPDPRAEGHRAESGKRFGDDAQARGRARVRPTPFTASFTTWSMLSAADHRAGRRRHHRGRPGRRDHGRRPRRTSPARPRPEVAELLAGLLFPRRLERRRHPRR